MCGEARHRKQRRGKPKKQASVVRKGSATSMPICRQGGRAGGGSGGATCANVTVLPVVEVPRRT